MDDAGSTRPAEPEHTDEPPTRGPRLALLLSAGAVLGALSMAAVPFLPGARNSPAGLSWAQSGQYALAVTAINEGWHIHRAQEQHKARTGRYVTDGTGLSEVDGGRIWPEGLVLEGISSLVNGEGISSQDPGYRLVFSSESAQHWCVHWTHRGFDAAKSHLPDWMKDALAAGM